MIVSELNELSKLLVSFREGAITREDVNVQISIYNQKDKRVRNSISYIALLIKAGMKREAKHILQGKLLGEPSDLIEHLPLYNRTAERGQ